MKRTMLLIPLFLISCGPAGEFDAIGLGTVDAGSVEASCFEPANVDPAGCQNGDLVPCYTCNGTEVKNDSPPPGTTCWCVLPVTG